MVTLASKNGLFGAERLDHRFDHDTWRVLDNHIADLDDRRCAARDAGGEFGRAEGDGGG
jgi:hypothetical protein